MTNNPRFITIANMRDRDLTLWLPRTYRILCAVAIEPTQATQVYIERTNEEQEEKRFVHLSFCSFAFEALNPEFEFVCPVIGSELSYPRSYGMLFLYARCGWKSEDQMRWLRSHGLLDDKDEPRYG
jgi:hypothetical protein